MGFSLKNRKRLLIFILVPILAFIPVFTDLFILKLISAVLLVAYVGVIIFLRDSVKTPPFDDEDEMQIKEEEDYSEERSVDEYDTDAGEGFEIVSGNKSIEVITADNIGSTPSEGNKNLFKPPDLKANFEKIATEKLPSDLGHDAQFEFVLEKILSVVKEAYLGHSAIFFWYSQKNNRLTLDKFVSSTSEITKQKFEIEDDILSKIVMNEEPELLTEISPTAEADVIRYYNKPQGIKSFVGVPLYYNERLAGILTLDSREPDVFGIETIYSLGKIIRVISVIISMFEDKYSESLSDQRLKGLLSVLNTDKKFETEDELQNSLVNSVKNLLPWDAFTFVYFNPQEQLFKTSRIVNKTSLKYVGEHLEVELNNTLVGKAILSGLPVKIDDTSESEYVRYSKSEDVNFEGSFFAVPLVFDKQNYGVLCMESLKKNVYSNEDVNFIKQATKIFSFIVYAYSSQSILRNLLSVDVETKTLNKKTFVERVGIDLIKAKGLKVPSALALIKIDEFLEQDSLFEGDLFPKVLESIVKIMREEITPLGLLGRLANKVFAVYFFNASTKDVYLWAEKLRIKIARNPIAVLSKQTTFTVSIGVASANEKTNFDDVYHNAELALEKAIETGGNSVKNIN
jgi:diguanylate cyclase (GGDEF)-like protein